MNNNNISSGDRNLLILVARLLEIPTPNGRPNKRKLDVFNLRYIETTIQGKTCGCAIGESYYLFPKFFDTCFVIENVKKCFEITLVEFKKLFMSADDGGILLSSASAEDVAYNIRDFVNKRRK